MIRSALEYASSFAVALSTAPSRALVLAHGAGLQPRPLQEVRRSLSDVIDHLCRCQDHGPDAGFGSFHLVKGHGASYPETTGYIIPTFILAAEVLARPELNERARRAADWLCSIQRPDGGWQGGRVGEDRPSIVFNTAQVIRGMLAICAQGNAPAHLASARMAGDWIVSVQEQDGSWARHNFLGASRVYDSYVDAPLLHLSELTGDPGYRRAAVLNLEWVLSCQQPNGWFANADNTIKHNDRPISHTLAYTLDGLLEAYGSTQDQRYLLAARKAADALLVGFLKEGRTAGRYDGRWRGSEASITTGCAQLAIVWSRLARIIGEDRYAQGASAMVQWLMAVQRLSDVGPAGAQGGVTGSYPLWGRYEKFAFPNWAQKYFADALLCVEGHLPRF